jgi:hypothetical protein
MHGTDLNVSDGHFEVSLAVLVPLVLQAGQIPTRRTTGAAGGGPDPGLAGLPTL